MENSIGGFISNQLAELQNLIGMYVGVRVIFFFLLPGLEFQDEHVANLKINAFICLLLELTYRYFMFVKMVCFVMNLYDVSDLLDLLF